jgi:hypothetical protein
MLLHIVLAHPALRRRVFGTLRAAAYLALVSAVGATCALRHAEANVGEQVAALGNELAKLPGGSEAHEVRINGQSVWVSNATSPMDKSAVLDAFEAHCKGGARDVDWKDVPQVRRELELKGMRVEGGVFRSESKDEGVVACVERGAASRATWWESVQEFAATHDVGALGKLRYAHVAQKNGASSITLLWTPDNLALDAIFQPPSDRDVEGSDFTDLPRLPGSRRTMSADVMGTPYGVRVYSATQTPEEAIAFYQQRLERDGWASLASDGAERAFVRLDRVVYVVAARADDGRTAVSVSVVSQTRGSM